MQHYHSIAATLVATASLAAEGISSPPAFTASRQDEDGSAFRNAHLQTHPLDSLRYIPLNKDGSFWMAVGGEIRVRYEYFNHANWGRGSQDPNGYLLHRYLQHADIHAGEHFRLFTEFQSGLENGRNGGPRSSDLDRFDLHQLFVDGKWDSSEVGSFRLRSGRQELAWGSQRLVSLRDSPNVRRAFDGMRLTVTRAHLDLDVFATRPTRIRTGVFDDDPDPDSAFWGAYGVTSLPGWPGAKADFYYLGLERDSGSFGQGNGHERRHSVGTRIWGRRSAWDWNWEWVYQFGEFGEGQISAWTVASDTGFTFENTPWSPRIGFKADVTSGDRDPTNPDLQTFNPLFPRGAYFSESGLLGPQNHVDLHPSLELHPTQSVTLVTGWDFFWRQNLHDGVYNIGQTLVRPGFQGDARFLGSQWNSQVEWKIHRHLSWVVHYAHFFAGPFFHQHPPDEDVDFLSSWISFKF